MILLTFWHVLFESENTGDGKLLFLFLNFFTIALKQLLLHLTLQTTKMELDHNSSIENDSFLWLKPLS